MCKWIKNILFPTNLLGKKKRCVTYQLPTNPATLPIEWTGERLRVTYTFIKSVPPKVIKKPVVYMFSDGNETEEILDTHKAGFSIAEERTIHFECTNVTHLEINGETII